MTEQSELPEEFTEKRQDLAEFLLTMATGYSWKQADGVDNFHFNYKADADEILKKNPHLLGLDTREQMGLWDEPYMATVLDYAAKDVEMVQRFYEERFGPVNAEAPAKPVNWFVRLWRRIFKKRK
ncbi:hypothetical protein PP914_gp177 [Arthrobacter phage Qui]|uniref:Uncharacterized protein n=1 Tax=Arthrobacter phage Qui TaxID=2603260 RepID=A0A5B8WKQ7_9CAUD|nr:hypothetical protein PP914_gp177 [Arthrobacter phage Qui]QED11665.1 hypothetical protein SEA_QUI_177 [Arthrobacter phage Qui]QOC56496.1 hypothetical protein SEA_PAELLA_177 [Arthrobacter phage Paella]